MQHDLTDTSNNAMASQDQRVFLEPGTAYPPSPSVFQVNRRGMTTEHHSTIPATLPLSAEALSPTFGEKQDILREILKTHGEAAMTRQVMATNNVAPIQIPGRSE